MASTTPAIVLSGIKYGESNLIVKAFTRERGLLSYWVPGVFGSRKGRMRSSFFQPLMLLEITGQERKRGTLERISELRPLHLRHSFGEDVRKVACALFISEVLAFCLAGEQEDRSMFDYVDRAVRWLDEQAFCPLFPAYFLWNLSAYLGVFPDTTDRNLSLFDLREGHFVASGGPGDSMDETAVELFLSLTEASLEELPEVGYSPGQPREQLSQAVRYFEYQIQGFRSPQSIAVLKDVFR